MIRVLSNLDFVVRAKRTSTSIEILIPVFFQISLKSSSALYHTIPERKRLTEYSPVNELKAMKNKVEIEGMKQAHVRLFRYLENPLPRNERQTAIHHVHLFSSLLGAKVVCWRPHLAGTRQYIPSRKNGEICTLHYERAVGSYDRPVFPDSSFEIFYLLIISADLIFRFVMQWHCVNTLHGWKRRYVWNLKIDSIITFFFKDFKYWLTMHVQIYCDFNILAPCQWGFHPDSQACKLTMNYSIIVEKRRWPVSVIPLTTNDMQVQVYGNNNNNKNKCLILISLLAQAGPSGLLNGLALRIAGLEHLC